LKGGSGEEEEEAQRVEECCCCRCETKGCVGKPPGSSRACASCVWACGREMRRGGEGGGEEEKNRRWLKCEQVRPHEQKHHPAA